MKPLSLIVGLVLVALGATPSVQKPSVQNNAAAHRTGLLFDDVYLRHLSGNTGHPERPERLLAIRDGLEKPGS